MLISSMGKSNGFYRIMTDTPKISFNDNSDKTAETKTTNKAAAASDILMQAREEHLKISLEVMKKISENHKTLFDILNQQRKPKIDDQEARRRRERQRRIDELCSQIAYHKKRAMDRENKRDAAMVSVLTSQLVRIMFD